MNILEEIIARRKDDIARLGYAYGLEIPETRAAHGARKFLERRGAILEVKRASPSKGDIAPNLDAPKTALEYAMSGAAAISVLTESHYFKGSLVDLMEVRAALDDAASSGKIAENETPAVLRKDFLIDEDDIEISHRAGADAVLLIARILEKERFLSMAEKVRGLGMSALVEVREDEDIEKIGWVFSKVDASNFVFGVNSRDLQDFSIDMLVPAKMSRAVKNAVSGARLVFESGILSENCAAFVGALGFDGFLMGEAAAKNPALTKKHINSFKESEPSANGKFWLDCAEKIKSAGAKPLVKICGITNVEDGLLAAELGADFLGLVFCKKSPRNTSGEATKKLREALLEKFGSARKAPRLVAVITEIDSDEGKAALSLARGGIVDAVQFHAFAPPEFGRKDFCDVPRYAALNVGGNDDIEKLKNLIRNGEPRVLIDSKAGGAVGGTGRRIDSDLILACGKEARLWLAGGITAENIRGIVDEFAPELVDVSSGVEASAGVKDERKLRALFDALSGF